MIFPLVLFFRCLPGIVPLQTLHCFTFRTSPFLFLIFPRGSKCSSMKAFIYIYVAWVISSSFQLITWSGIDNQ